MAPIEYIGRYMRGWFDFAIADELHQLAGDTAQGNGLGVLERAAQRLTVWLMKDTNSWEQSSPLAQR